MITIKNLTAKNFMSIGNASQAVNFNRQDLTLVLGENLDQGGNGARNGVGKSTIINALSYALYGTAISNIKLNNLINKTNAKNMLVSIDFDIDTINYRIERGRKPNLLRFFVNNEEQKEDEQHGEMRDTQKEINSLLNISHDMFAHTITLNTYSEPFLSMRAHDQKIIIEQLLGITLLTEKAEKLKEINKQSKTNIIEEEFRIAAIIKANQHMEDQIKKLKMRQKVWIDKNIQQISEHSLSINQLQEVDIDSEIKAHHFNTKEKSRIEQANIKGNAEIEKQNAEDRVDYDLNVAEIKVFDTAVKECNKWIDSIIKDDKTLNRRITALETDIELIKDHKCHACGQDLHDKKHDENLKAKEQELQECVMQLLTNQTQENEHKMKLAELGECVSALPKPTDLEFKDEIFSKTETFYDDLEMATDHKANLEMFHIHLETAMSALDPYIEQIVESQTNGLVEVSYNKLNSISELQDHQAFLLKLLTSKDSFIRRKIIEQNLSYLNNRLTHYLDEIGLPHKVVFLSDLSVEITELGRDLDEGNLSRGERTRLILALSWAFRDVHESLYSHINLLFVDELIDSGLDTIGVEDAMKILKRMARERKKSVWIVSHREELISRVHNTLNVIKSNGFTTYNN